VSGIFPTKNYQNLIIDFQITVENVGDTFFETQNSAVISYFETVTKKL